MTRKRISKILLVTEKGQKAELNIDHAERLLNRSKNGGWKLPEDSTFIFEGKKLVKKPKDSE